MSVSARDVAARMLAEVERAGELYQQDAVAEIEQRFGTDFVYYNDNGNPAVSRAMLKGIPLPARRTDSVG